MPNESRWLSALAKSPGVGIDREQGVLRGYVVAQAGPFKSRGRGEFDEPALKQIVSLMNSSRGGVKSRLSHPTLSNDGIGKFLGRARSARLDSVRLPDENGKGQQVPAVRADLHFDRTAFNTPNGDLAGYIMDLAESDSDALSSSLVLQADENYRLDAKTGKPARDASGELLPPLWTPTRVHASDIVDTGDAVDGLLSAHQIDIDGLPDELVRRGCELLDAAFPNTDRETIERRLLGWVDRYLETRFGERPAGMSRGLAEAIIATMEAERR